MRYILLLRGINVGGKNKVVMRELSVLLTDAGFEEVGSYINSGNLFFGSDEQKEHCISKIRSLLEAQYYFPIPFALLTKEEYLEERDALPDWWHGEMARRDVLFYACGMDTDRVRDFIEKAALYNEVVHLGRHARELFAHCGVLPRAAHDEGRCADYPRRCGAQLFSGRER